MRAPVRIEGYAIVSEDGMLADAEGVMPVSLKIDADQQFFAQGLERADLVVHGRNSHELQPNSSGRRRVIVTAAVPAIAPASSNGKTICWNPAGASFDQALAAFESAPRVVAVIGGTRVFELFLDRYDVFYLSRVTGVRLPGGRPIFPGVPSLTPEAVLAAHGLDRPEPELVAPANGLTITAWQRPGN